MLFLNYTIIFLALLVMWKVHMKFSLKANKRFIMITIFLFAFLLANRGIETHDTQNYMTIYESVTPSMIMQFSFLKKYLGVEYGFILLISIFKGLGIGIRTFFFFIAYFNCFVAVKSLTEIAWYWLGKKENRINIQYLTLVLYISGFGMLYMGIVIRGGLSIALCLYALKLILCDCKKVKSLIVFVIAFSMHRMSINLIIILCIIYLVKINNTKTQLGILFGEAILFFSGITVPFMHFITYSMLAINNILGINGYSSFLSSLDTKIGKIDIYILIVCFCVICLTKNCKKMAHTKNIILAGGMILTFGYGIRALSRVYDYYMIMQIPLLAGSYKEIKKSKVNTLIFYCLLIGNLVVMYSICS